MTLVVHTSAPAVRIKDIRDYFAIAQPQPLSLRDERAVDFAAREAPLDAGFGANRAEKTSERLREGRLPAQGLALTAAENGALAGTLRPRTGGRRAGGRAGDGAGERRHGDGAGGVGGAACT